MVLSRPTQRLYWINVDPTKETITESLQFLNGRMDNRQVSVAVPAGVLRSLDEEQLDTEERIHAARRTRDRSCGSHF